MIRHRAPGRTPLVAVGLALVLAACSSNSPTQPTQSLSASAVPPVQSPSTSAAGGTTDCASLATAADVSAIVGETVTGPNSASTNAIPGLQATACNYTAPDGTAAFSFGQGPNATTVNLIFQQSKQAQGGEDVAGLGDSAYFSSTFDNLLVIKGSMFLSVGVLLASASDPASEKAADLALAQLVLPKL
jgi:hypothetical protein